MATKTVKGVRDKNKGGDLKIDLLEAGVSYALTLSKDDDYLNHLVSAYIFNLNKEAGYHRGVSLLDNYYLVSDKEEPTSKYHVISLVKRDSKDFIAVDVDKDGIKVIIQLLGFGDNQNIISYVLKYMTYKSPRVTMSYMLALRSIASGDATEDSKALKELIHNRVFEGVYYKDKILTIVKALSLPSPKNWMDVHSMCTEEDINVDSFSYILNGLIEKGIPDYLKEESSQIKTSNYFPNLLTLQTFCISAHDIEQVTLKGVSM